MNKLYKKVKSCLFVGVAGLAIFSMAIAGSDAIKTNAETAINYVSMGDSMTTGFGYDDYYIDGAGYGADENGHENVRGFLTSAKESYPALIAKELETRTGRTVNWTQLGANSMRVNDMYYALSGIEEADEYFNNVFSPSGTGPHAENWYNEYAQQAKTKGLAKESDSALVAVTKAFQTTVKNADFITLNAGFNNFGAFVTGRLGNFVESQQPIDLLPSWAGTDTLSDFLELTGFDFCKKAIEEEGKSWEELLQLFCDRVGLSINVEELITSAYDIINKVSNDALEGSGLKDYINIVDNFKVVEFNVGGSPVKFHLDQLVDSFAFAFVSYCYYFNELTKLIYELNPDVNLIVLGLYNQIKDVKLKFNDLIINLGEIYQKLIESANFYAGFCSEESDRFIYVNLIDLPIEMHLDNLANGNYAIGEEGANGGEAHRLYEGVSTVFRQFLGLDYDADKIKSLANEDTSDFTNLEALVVKNLIGNIKVAAGSDTIDCMGLLKAFSDISNPANLNLGSFLSMMSGGKLNDFFNVYTRILLSNGIWSHPSIAGHKLIAQAVMQYYDLGMTSRQYWTYQIAAFCQEKFGEYYDKLVSYFKGKWHTLKKVAREELEKYKVQGIDGGDEYIDDLLHNMGLLEDDFWLFFDKAEVLFNDFVDDILMPGIGDALAAYHEATLGAEEEIAAAQAQIQIINAQKDASLAATREALINTIEVSRQAILQARVVFDQEIRKFVAWCRENTAFEVSVHKAIFEKVQELAQIFTEVFMPKFKAIKETIKEIDAYAYPMLPTIKQYFEQYESDFYKLGLLILKVNHDFAAKVWPCHDWDMYWDMSYINTTYTWDLTSDVVTCTAKRTCEICGEVCEETVNGVRIEAQSKDATCYSAGYSYYEATFEHFLPDYSEKKDLPVIDHSAHHEVTYDWADDNKSCTAKLVCSECDYKLTENSVRVDVDHTVVPTCKAEGTDTLTAVFPTLPSDTKQVKVEKLNHTEADYKTEYTFSDDYKSCTAVKTCPICSIEIDRETVSGSSITEKEYVAPKCEVDGYRIYTATFTKFPAYDSDKVKIDALVHDHTGNALVHNDADYYNKHWYICNNGCGKHLEEEEHTLKTEYKWFLVDGEWTCKAIAKCTVCDFTLPGEAISVTSEVAKEATCAEKGQTEYTATFADNRLGNTSMVVIDIPKSTVHPVDEVEWTIDTDNGTHYKLCPVCGDHVFEEEHIEGAHVHYTWYQDASEWKVDAIRRCVICDADMTTLATVTAVRGDKIDAVCERSEGYHYTATFPGLGLDDITRDIFSGEIKHHDPEDEFSYDENGHWYDCKNDGCEAQLEYAEHDFEITYTWAQDEDGYWYCTAKAVCKCKYEVEEVATFENEKVDWDYVSIPDCVNAGAVRVWAEFEDELFEDGSEKEFDIPANGHDEFDTYDETEHWIECWVCGNRREVEAHNFADPQFVETSMLGINVGVKATVCGDCGYQLSETAFRSEPVVVLPTCTEPGKYIYTYNFLEFDDEVVEVAIPAHGHEPVELWSSDGTNHWHVCAYDGCRIVLDSTKGAHTYGDASYFWNKEGDSWYCYAERYCTVCGHAETEKVKAVSKTTTNAKCGSVGVVNYKATFTNTAFGSKEINDVIPATGAHNYGAVVYAWATDNKSCTATKTCSVCNDKVVETAIIEPVVEVAATCENVGSTRYNAYFTTLGNTSKVLNDIPALGHNYGDEWHLDATNHWHVCETCGGRKDSAAHTFVTEYEWRLEEGKWTCRGHKVCSVCEYRIDENAVITSAIEVAPTLTEKGSTKYTAQFVNIASTEKVVVDIEILDYVVEANGTITVDMERVARGIDLIGLFKDAAALNKNVVMVLGDVTLKFSPESVASIASNKEAVFSFNYFNEEVKEWINNGQTVSAIVIGLQNNGFPIKFEGSVEISLPDAVEPGFAHEAKVYFIDELNNNRLVEVESELADDVMTFNVTHFSTYAVVNEFNCLAWEMVLIYAAVVLAAAAIIVVCVLVRRKK